MTATEIQLPAIPVLLWLDPARGTSAVRWLRTAGGHCIAAVPVAARLNPVQAGRLFRAWLVEGRTLDWQDTTRILAEAGAAA